MRKRTINQDPQNVSPSDQQWLNVETLAQVEVTSEDAANPIESALLPGAGSGWLAAGSGQQTIRLLFDEPQRLRRLHLVFQDDHHERTQQFVVCWSPDGGHSYREIVRQQYHFSPPTTNREVEDYTVDLNGVTALELKIVPDISGSRVYASLMQLSLA